MNLHLRNLGLILLFFLQTILCNDRNPLILKSRLGAGFFAELHNVMTYIILTKFNEPIGKEIDVQWREEFFPYKNDINENGWNLFFEPIGYIAKEKNIQGAEIIHDQNCLNKWLNYNNFYSYRMGMHKILSQYIKIKQEILSEVDNYKNRYMNNIVCIGVHVRFSGAHTNEKPGIVTLDDYFSEINSLIKSLHKSYKIYLATDSQYVVNQFKQRYKDNLLYIDALRSEYNGEVHLIYANPDYWLSHPQEFHAKKPGYKGGKDALMDCLLLSKCDYLIHTTSNVSDYATFFNPDIQSIFLPKKISPKIRVCLACNSKNQWWTKEF